VSAPITLNATGATSINIVVTAQDGVTTRSYNISVSHAALGDANLRSIAINENTINPPPGTGTYYGSVTETETNEIVIRAVPFDAHGATVTVDGVSVHPPIWEYPYETLLERGSLVYDILVTAADKITTREYFITVTQGNPEFAARLAPGNTELVTPGNTEVSVHSALSPNGDGIDDHLTIDGISAHPDNTLSIMDGNGALVYTKRGYDNATDAFDGHASNGKMQKPGTYYYVLQYKSGTEVKVKSGYVVLKY
jgi:gliding motility-associated-like protein